VADAALAVGRQRELYLEWLLDRQRADPVDLLQFDFSFSSESEARRGTGPFELHYSGHDPPALNDVVSQVGLVSAERYAMELPRRIRGVVLESLLRRGSLAD